MPPKIIPENVEATAETPGNKINVMPSLGGNVSAVGDAITKIADQYQKAALLGETTRAQNQLNLRIGELTQEAAHDQDLSPERHRYYNEQLQKAISESQQQISLPTAKTQFAAESQDNVNMAALKINAVRIKKYIDLNKGELETYQQNQENNYLNAINPAEKQKATLESDRKFDEAVQGGYMTAKDMEKAKIKRNQTWDENQALLDRHADPDRTLAELQKGTSGAYKNLMPTQREKLITSTLQYKNKVMKENDQLTAIARNTSEAALIEKHLDGQLTTKEVEDLHAQKQISDQFADSMIKTLSEPVIVPTSVDKFKGYQDIVKKIADPKTSTEQINGIIMDGLKTHRLTLDEAKNIWQSTLSDENGQHISLAKMIQDNRTKKPDDIIRQRNKMERQVEENQHWWASAINSIDDWSRRQNKSPEDQARVTSTFFQQMASQNKKSDAAVGVAKSLINQSNVKTNPYFAFLPDKGGWMQDKVTGAKVWCTRDGNCEEKNQ